MYAQFVRQLSMRTRLLLANRELPLRDRWRIACSPRAGRAAMRWLIEERLEGGPGGPHFRIAGRTVAFQPDYPISDREELLAGIAQVLVESFVFPDLFWRTVGIQPGDVVLDLGANIGTTALVFSELAGAAGRVYAFEPVVHRLCVENIERNAASNVTVVPCGVAEAAGAAEFHVTDFCLDSRSSPAGFGDRGPTHRITAPLVRLDDWIAERRIERVDFVKMDIEGAEESALRGATRLVARFRPKWSISSYHLDAGGEPQHPKLVRLLSSWGYRVREVGRSRIFAW